MISVGILNPSWTISLHNTDQRCVVDLLGMKEHTDSLVFDFASSDAQQFAANINRVTERLFSKRLIPVITVKPRIASDVYYHYSGEIHGLTLSPEISRPTVSTLGFPTLLEDRARGTAYLKQQAAVLIAQAKRSALVHFHTDCMRHAFLAYAPDWENRCATVPFYMPHLELTTEAAVRSKFQSSKRKILFVGNGPYKGLPELCTALDSISDVLNARDVEVTIVSKSKPNCTRVRNIQHIPRLSRKQVQEQMRQSHIYAMVPHRESFGLVYVEAMAAGCALLSDHDIPRQEILDGGKCGLLVPPGQPDQIAKSLLQLLDDTDTSLQMALHGLHRAATRYAPKLVAEQYAAAFASVA